MAAHCVQSRPFKSSPLSSLPSLQGSQWIDSSVQQRFEPFSECAAGHVAGGCRGAAVAAAAVAAAALCSGSRRDQLLLSGLLAITHVCARSARHASGSRLPCGFSCSQSQDGQHCAVHLATALPSFCRFPAAQTARFAPLPLPHSQGQEGRCPALLQPQARRQAGQRLHAHRLPGGEGRQVDRCVVECYWTAPPCTASALRGEGRQVDRCGRAVCCTAAKRCVWGLHAYWLSAMGRRGAEGDAVSALLCSALLCLLASCTAHLQFRRAYCFCTAATKWIHTLPFRPALIGKEPAEKASQGRERARNSNTGSVGQLLLWRPESASPWSRAAAPGSTQPIAFYNPPLPDCVP